MKTREEVNRLKQQLWWRMVHKEEVSPEVEGFEEYRGELAHFIEWVKAGGNWIDAHNLAAECGILDNMALASRIALLESRLDDLACPYPNQD